MQSAGVYPAAPAIHRLLESQASATPLAVAMVCGRRHWTYDALNRKADHIAGQLRGRGVGAETRVGLLVERSPEVALGMLAILKAGAAFVPLDPNYPQDRLAMMLSDAGSTLVLTRKPHQELLSDLVEALCVLDGDPEASFSAEQAGEEFPLQCTAYVVYTSGSTGRPKGVPVSHTHFIPLMHWAKEYFALGPPIRALQTLSFGFDFGVFEVLSTLLFGGTLYFPEQRDLRNLERYGELVRQYGINTVHSTPSIFKQITDLDGRLNSIRLVHLGGEAIAKSIVEAVFTAAPDCQLFNGYGPTETTVNSTIFALRDLPTDMPEDYELPIGHMSVHNTGHVLNVHGLPVAHGELGELVIGGGGVTRGYLHQPALTATRFVPDPFTATAGARMYRTGDRVRRLDDGGLQFHGRFDHQIKIRGFRVELGEIESALAEHPSVEDAVVLVRRAADERRALAAYIQARPGGRPTSRDLADYLRLRLPAHMIPLTWQVLDAFPLNANGKVDRAALLALQKTAFSETSTFSQALNLTANQSLFWFTHKLYAGRELYYDRTPVAFTIHGDLDPRAFHVAFQYLVDQSDTLRSRIEDIDGLPRRTVRGPFAVEVDLVDLSRLEDPSNALDKYLYERREAPMNFATRLVDTALVHLGPRRWLWYLNLFHILADAWSIQLIFQFVSDYYRRFGDGTLAEAPEMVPFQDFVDSQFELQETKRYENAKKYWRTKLARPLVINHFYGLPSDPTTTETLRHSVDLGMERSEGLREVARTQGFFSPAILFATLVFAYLHRLSGERRLRLGTPFASRPAQFRECIGLFMTVCPTEVEIDEGETLLSLARKAQMEIARTTRHEFYSVRNPAVAPAYDVHLNFQNISFPDFCGMPSDFELLMSGRSNDRLNLQVRDWAGSGRYLLDFDFNLGAFAREDQRRRSIEHFLNLVDALIQDAEQPLSHIRFLSNEEEQKLLTRTTEGARAYILDQNLHLLPDGIVGEVHLARAGEIGNADVWVDDPFNDGGRLLKTGQRGRWLADGGLQILGDLEPAEVLGFATTDGFVAPRSRLESEVAAIYARILGVEEVGIHDDFFGLGGNSILATQMVLALRQQLSIKLPLRHVFEASDVARLAAVLERLRGTADS